MKETTIAAGANCKMNEFAAAMGICNLRHVEEEIIKRKKVEDKYRELLSGTPGLILKTIQEDVQTNSSYFPVIIEPEVFGKTRDEVHSILQDNGIGSRKYFYPLTNEFEYTRNICNNSTPIAKDLSEKVLTLPLYADLALEEVERICGLIIGD